MRFDDNAFDINVGHYYAGVGYYLAARTSGLSRWESLLTAGVASSFWEYVSEYREVVSINDQINTTFGGAIIGETTWQMCKIFQIARASSINSLMKGVCQGPRKMSSWLQSKISNNEPVVEDLNIRPDIWAKLDLSLGIQANQHREKTQSLGLSGEVIAIPLFEEPGRVKEILTGETVAAQMQFAAAVGGSMNTFKLFTKTVLAAYYDKNLGRNRKGDLEGYNLFVGPSAALEIEETTYGGDEKNPGNDFRGIVHILGGTVDLVMYHQGYRLRATLDIYGDFAMIRSYAFDNYKKLNATDGVTSLLVNEGYYYGLGMTEKVSVSLEKGPLSAGISLSQTNITSIERAERDYKEKTRDLSPTDLVFTSKTWLVYELSKSWKAELGLEMKRRKGTINQSSDVTAKEIIKYGKLIYQLY